MASQSQFPGLVGKKEIEVLVGGKAFVGTSFLLTEPLEPDALLRLREALCDGDVPSVQPNRTQIASACCLLLDLELQYGSKMSLLVQGTLVKGSQEAMEQEVKKHAEHMIKDSTKQIDPLMEKTGNIEDSTKQIDLLWEKTGNIEDRVRQIELSKEMMTLGKMFLGWAMGWCITNVLLRQAKMASRSRFSSTK